MRTLTIDDRQLAVNALVSTMKEIDPDGVHVGLISVSEAIAFVRDHHTDVVFLDVEMPEKNGLIVAQELKELQPDINIIFVTGHDEYALDAHALYVSGYLTKPASVEDVRNALSNLRNPIQSDKPKVFIRCFGYFEVFVDGEPLVFKRSKSKELLAYLVDSNGAFCSTGELIGILWEDEDITDSKLSQIRSFISDIRKTFDKVGLGEVIKKEYNAIAIRTDRVDCDYYNFLSGNAEGGTFMGEYMKQYAWAEVRVGELMNM